MARRSNRQYRRASRSSQAQSSTTTASSRKTTDFEPDYGYVIKDLRRIGLYAGICIVILLALTFLF
jgi:hypothetical protein